MKAVSGTILAVDVGGTTINSAAISSDLRLIGEPYTIASNNVAPQEVILRNIEEAVTKASVDTPEIQACGIAFPGPFDYTHGISRMEHKFRAIRNFSLKDWLQARRDFPFFFLNDADAFGYGVLSKGYDEPPERLVTITLGTGVGSSYFERGVLHNLGIWNAPYRGGILEDAISARAITRRYTEVTKEQRTVKEQAELAGKGDQVAQDAFREFGGQLGMGLAETVGLLHPTVIAIGGAISKSSSLFEHEAERAYRSETGQEVVFDWSHDNNMALYGAAAFALQRLQ